MFTQGPFASYKNTYCHHSYKQVPCPCTWDACLSPSYRRKMIHRNKTRLRNEKRHSRPWSPPRWPTGSWPLGWNVAWCFSGVLDWKFVVKNANTHLKQTCWFQNGNSSTKVGVKIYKSINIKCLNVFETNTYSRYDSCRVSPVSYMIELSSDKT